MKRREFILSTSLASAGSAVLGVHSAFPKEGISTAADMQKYLRSLHKVAEPSVDRIVIGDPATVIRKVGTCWQPYFHTLLRATDMGINLMIVHEPTFYTHWDLDTEPGLFYSTPEPAREKYLEAIEKKKTWIEENGMVIIRSHDVPDILNGFGIPFALGDALGYDGDKLIRSKDYYHVYRITPGKALNVAGNIARSLSVYGYPGTGIHSP